VRVLITVLGALALLTAGCSRAGTSVAPIAPGSTFLSTLSPKTTFHWTVAQGGNTGVDGWLDGVDCVTETMCVAVGNESAPSGGSVDALVETWNGSRWSHIVAPPASEVAPADWLFSVSCANEASCVAVGYFFALKHGGSADGLIETLADGTWTASPIQLPGGDIVDSFLNGVSCTSPTSCVAVGYTLSTKFVPRPLILGLADGSWSVMPSPSLDPGSGGLQAVSCTKRNSCVAVGDRSTGSTDETLVETLHGGNWVIMPSSGAVPGVVGAGLNDVSCLTAASCVAVGRLEGPVPTIEVEADQAWPIMKSPKPNPNDGATGLYGVSCTHTTSCVAVGDLAAASSSAAKTTPAGALASPLDPLIETNSKGTWSVASPPGLSPGGGLRSVSCSGRTCVAVGQSAQVTNTADVMKTLIVQSLSDGAS
jgi:hypothetical protein